MSIKTDGGIIDSIGDRLRNTNVKRIALYVVLIGLLVFYLVPLESGLMTAFKTQTGFTQTLPYVPPSLEEFTLNPWVTAWGRLQSAMLNSAAFAIPATLLSGVIGSITAYGLTKTNWYGQVGVFALFLAGVFIPYQAVLVPLTQIWSIINLPAIVDNIPLLSGNAGLIELMITHVAYGIPICTLLFRSYYQSINDEMLEAARLDGAGLYRIYRRIILPLSGPMFAVVFIYQFTQVWNDLLFALVLITNPSNGVVTTALNELQGSMVQQYNLQMAGAFIAALPTLLVYVLFSDRFAEGVGGQT